MDHERGAYRVTESAWSERSYRVATVEQTDMGPMFTLEGWTGKVQVRDLQKVREDDGATGSIPASAKEISPTTSARSSTTNCLKNAIKNELRTDAVAMMTCPVGLGIKQIHALQHVEHSHNYPRKKRAQD